MRTTARRELACEEERYRNRDKQVAERQTHTDKQTERARDRHVVPG